MLSSADHFRQFAEALDSMQAKHRGMMRQFTRRDVRDAMDAFVDQFEANAKRRRDLLTNPALTAFVPVTLAEPWVVEQTERLIRDVRAEGIDVPFTILNRAVADDDCDRTRDDAARKRLAPVVDAPRACVPLDTAQAIESWSAGERSSAGGSPAVPPAARRRLYAFTIAIILFLPGFWLALHQPAEARAWMKIAWPDVLFVRPPIAIAIIGAIALAMSIRVNRYALMVLIPFFLAIALRVYVPLRFEAVVAAPFALWLAESLKQNRFRLALTTTLAAVCVVWTTLGILDHASRPPDSYRQAAAWAASHVPANETVVATGYLYLETMMNGHARVAAFPPEQGMHPGWRALPQPGLRSPSGAFFWIGERRAPELGVLRRDRRIIEPLFINDRAMVALVR
jgi:hypothetical protein